MDTFIIDLKLPANVGKTFDFHEGDEFFQTQDSDIQGGDVETKVSVKGEAGLYRIHVHSVGSVVLPCDRCLADMNLRIDAEHELVVKLGLTYEDDGDVVVLPEEDPKIDMSDFIMQFILLSLPLKHTHEPGMCDDAMMEVLQTHLAARSDHEEDEADEQEEG